MKPPFYEHPKHHPNDVVNTHPFFKEAQAIIDKHNVTSLEIRPSGYKSDNNPELNKALYVHFTADVNDRDLHSDLLNTFHFNYRVNDMRLRVRNVSTRKQRSLFLHLAY